MSFAETMWQLWEDNISPIVRMPKRQLAHQILNLLLIICSALMIWKGLQAFTKSESPVVVVLSGSMEPAYYRGDILILTLGDAPFEIGEIIVFKLRDRDIPIVHRILNVHTKDDGSQYILTKGDNNMVNDRGLYNQGQLWLGREDVVGRTVAYIPYAGMITIIMNDYPMLKFILIGAMGVLVLASRE